MGGDNRITDLSGEPIDLVRKAKRERLNNEENKRIEDMNLEEIFEKCRDRLIFDPLVNRIDFSKRRATDYKLNRSVILPAPLDNDKELECELRRKGYMAAFDEYIEEDFNRKKTGLTVGKLGVKDRNKKSESVKEQSKTLRKRKKE